VTISDDGQPFDPTTVSEPDLEIPLHERSIGGLGIVFIKNISKNFTYHRVDNRNILEIQLNKDAI
jgi:serine/threonine-protein kinase RsbW